MKPAAYPFPFFGAGDAAYYEWVSFNILFEVAPTAAQTERIVALAPRPLTSDGEVWMRNEDGSHIEDRLWLVGCGPDTQALIETHYPSGEEEDGDGPHLGREDEAFSALASPSQVHAFNEHIDAWLLAVHEIAPIVFVLRPEDPETDGTELSKWHRWSVNNAEVALAELKTLHGMNPNEERIDFEAMCDFIAEGGGALPRYWRAWLAQPTHALKAIRQGNAEKLKSSLDSFPPSSRTIEAINQGLSEFMTQLAQSEPQSARECFDLVIGLPGLDPWHYVTALWVVQTDNTHLPVDPERARRYLEAALPHADRTPAIYLNAACVVFELGETAQAFEYLKKAARAGSPGLEEVRNASMFASVAEDPRFLAALSGADGPVAPL